MTDPAHHVSLRDVVLDDVPIFFEHQRDEEAHRMAAMSGRDPADRAGFEAHWRRLLGDDSVIKQTILCDGSVAGNVVCFDLLGERAVGYWLGRAWWGRGIATDALDQFLRSVETRPLHARVAKDNVASRRVLEKCGFAIVGEDVGYSSARDADVEEWIMRLDRTTT